MFEDDFGQEYDQLPACQSDNDPTVATCSRRLQMRKIFEPLFVSNSYSQSTKGSMQARQTCRLLFIHHLTFANAAHATDGFHWL